MNTKSNQDKFATDLRIFVHASMTADAGPAFMLHKHYPKVCNMLDAFTAKRDAAAQRNEKFSTRDALLSLYRETPVGEDAVKELEEIKATKKAVRSSDQSSRLQELQRMDNKVFIQLQRLIMACDGVRALRNADRIVHFEPRTDKTTDAVLSVVIRVRMKDEISAQVFTLKALSNVTAVDWNASGENVTPTAELFTLADKYRATPLPNASNGDAVEPAKMADTAKALDTSISGKTMAKDGGISPKAREELTALWARLDSMLSAKQKAKALAAFNEGAQEEKPADAA